MKVKIIAAASAALILGTSAVYAEDFYVLASIGQSKLDLGAGLSANATGYKSQLGYRVNKHFALEGGYFNMGKVSIGPATIEGDGWNLSAIGYLPLTDEFSIFGKLGAAYISSKASGAGRTFSASENRAIYGVGLNYDVSKAVALRTEYEVYDQDVNALSLGIAFKF